MQNDAHVSRASTLLTFALATACASRPASSRGAEEQAASQSPAASVASTGSRAEAMPAKATDGALEIGDPYFPGLGNGGYDVEHYSLEIEVDMLSDEIEATATLRARALHDLASFSLDLYGLDVESVRVDGKEARFERPAPPPPAANAKGPAPQPSELVIRPAAPLASGSIFETEVRYSGTPVVRPDPSVPFLPGTGWFRQESGVYVVSECIGASSWFPCNDHPRDKASYSFRITVDEPYTVAANGILQEVIEQGDERTFVFEARDPMASYLVTVDVAEFGVIEDVGPRGIPVRIYHPVDATEDELDDFRRQPEVLEFLESRFGPYPFEAAGGVLAYEQIGGALECQTIPVYGRGCNVDVIVHELAHQWYGDAVSPDLWRDMWLNEGFASYAGWLWEEHLGGAERYRQTVRDAYRELRQRKTGSPFDPGVSRVFSGRVYTRGAMVLHGLRTEVGDDAFFTTLRSWAETRHEKNGSTHDFVKHASKVAERDLGEFFDRWLFSEVTPEIPAFEPLEPEPEPGKGQREPQASDG